jgi:hypothetical protein
LFSLSPEIPPVISVAEIYLNGIYNCSYKYLHKLRPNTVFPEPEIPVNKIPLGGEMFKA